MECNIHYKHRMLLFVALLLELLNGACLIKPASVRLLHLWLRYRCLCFIPQKYAIERQLGVDQFDPINQMIPLTVIPLSGAHCISNIAGKLFLFENMMIVKSDILRQKLVDSNITIIQMFIPY